MTDMAHPPAAPAKRRARLGLLRRLNLSTWIGLVIVVALVLAAIFAPWLTEYSPSKQNILHQLSPPGDGHLLGTDQYGRDIWARLLYGARY